MAIEDINQQIEQKKARYEKRMLDLDKEKCKAKEQYQRDMDYLNGLKRQLQAKQTQSNEAFYSKTKTERLVETLLELIKQAMDN